MDIGVVSAGHMGSGLGWALRSGGARVLTVVEGRSPRTARLAAATGLTPVADLAELVSAAGVVLVVTPPGAARAAARDIAAAAARTGARPLVADLNATAPSTVEALADTYAGLPFVDGAISGPPPTVRPGARIYLSGPRAAEVAALPWRHVRPVTVPGPAGRASAVKMSTASVYKGLDALVAQAMRAAAHYGVLDEVLADLRTAGLDRPSRVAVAAAKAHRFVPEMREIAAAQATAGLTPALFEALAQVYAELATSQLGTVDPETVDRDLTPEQIVAAIAPGGPAAR
jgi:3-hydroxyisobutyrate dehydrogenase-like beta-hydroxyacid dehydrogenase